MIAYKREGIHHLLNLFQGSGSVFPKAALLALPSTVAAIIFRILIDHHPSFEIFSSDDSILSNTQVFGGFHFLVGFIIVFRTSQAYTRFWHGATCTHRMRAEWFDAASALAAFCHRASVPKTEVMRFLHILTRLFSIMHSAAMAQLEIELCDMDDQPHDNNIDRLRSFTYDVLDPEGLDEVSLQELKKSEFRVELVFEWIQSLIVCEMKSGVLTIPAPILSRAFQELANGMVAFHEAQQISFVPFPFPYAQTCDACLLLYAIVNPFVTTQWVKSAFWVGVFVFIQLMVLYALNFIAVEIENPFGCDANDLDGEKMQCEFNKQLLMLLSSGTQRLPTLSSKVRLGDDADGPRPAIKRSLSDIWQGGPSYHRNRREGVLDRSMSLFSDDDSLAAPLSSSTPDNVDGCEEEVKVFSSQPSEASSPCKSQAALKSCDDLGKAFSVVANLSQALQSAQVALSVASPCRSPNRRRLSSRDYSIDRYQSHNSDVSQSASSSAAPHFLRREPGAVIGDDSTESRQANQCLQNTPSASPQVSPDRGGGVAGMLLRGSEGDSSHRRDAASPGLSMDMIVPVAQDSTLAQGQAADSRFDC